uniref:Uncharacterized protein n=1 Tax=Rhipicephalus appendiculatus TaxID=34631 RepID=A0A131YIN8_RHIAP
MQERRCVLLTAAALLLILGNIVCMWKVFHSMNSCDEPHYGKHSETVKGPLIEDDTLNETLPATFTAALQAYPVVPTSVVKRILIVTYHQSGVTLLGKLLTHVPRTFFHFEPFALFTQGGRIRPSKERYALELLDELARCRLWKVPLYAISLGGSGGSYKFNRFLADVCQGGDSCSSPSYVSSLCLRAETQAFEVKRLSVSQVSRWIQRNPDIAESVRVIHLVRDPREIYASRRDLDSCRAGDSCFSAKALCSQMRSDLRAFEDLEKQMGRNKICRLRIEDLSSDPVNQTKQLFARLGLDLHPNVLSFLRREDTGIVTKLGKQHHTTSNASTLGDSWKTRLPKNTIREIEEMCADVLLKLDYERVFHSVNSAEQSNLAQIPPPPIFAR